MQLARRFCALPIAAILLSACPRTGPAGPTFSETEIPNDAGAIVSLADSLYERRAPGDAENALYALELGRKRFPENTDIAWRAARVCAWLGGNTDASRETRIDLARRGASHARKCAEGSPDAVEGHYYLAVNIGLHARTMSTGALELIPGMEKAARRAVEIDESYESGGPLRMLGMLLVRAPPWPDSIGDVEEGVRTLEKAVARFPGVPLNRVLLAEALIETAQYERAKEELAKVLDAPPEGEWALLGARWRSRARALLAEIADMTGDADGAVPR